ncbi:MAG TPA: hypothetical protein VM580_20480, partial [Labilithrix sp.]|nr:hypothetical protein [Labilithrix sp.]
MRRDLLPSRFVYRARVRRRTGADELARWLKKHAARPRSIFALEEALLSGRFAVYAARRLLAFFLSRAWAAALHIVEFTYLAEIFSARPFVASLALQNVAMVVDALYWGALEALRRRLRELGPGSEAAALTTRWMATGAWAGGAIVVVPVARAAWSWHLAGNAPSILEAYALVCALRLAADIVLRTYYSGIFAHQRVHRPAWSTLVGPLLLVFVTVLCWDALAGWSFPIALVVSVAGSRALLCVFSARAYRAARIPSPSLRLVPRRLKFAGANHRDVVLAAIANVSTRMGGLVLLAAVIPSLAAGDAFAEVDVSPFAFAVHLAAPLLFMTSQWSGVFYHDWKRLESE